MLHLMPDRVVREAIQDVPPPESVLASYRRGHPPTPPLATRGVSGYPSRGTAEKGARIFHRYVDELTLLLQARGREIKESQDESPVQD
jgi:creatinine amidohydrolase/Fe(II)-dependent formamide hydrolase-like protein